jgi:hypothetical protein
MNKPAYKIGPNKVRVYIFAKWRSFEEPYQRHSAQDISKISKNRRLKGITKNHPSVYFPLGGFFTAKGPEAIYF